MICPKCGTVLPGHATFCPECGSPVECFSNSVNVDALDDDSTRILVAEDDEATRVLVPDDDEATRVLVPDAADDSSAPGFGGQTTPSVTSVTGGSSIPVAQRVEPSPHQTAASASPWEAAAAVVEGGDFVQQETVEDRQRKKNVGYTLFFIVAFIVIALVIMNFTTCSNGSAPAGSSGSSGSSETSASSDSGFSSALDQLLSGKEMHTIGGVQYEVPTGWTEREQADGKINYRLSRYSGANIDVWIDPDHWIMEGYDPQEVVDSIGWEDETSEPESSEILTIGDFTAYRFVHTWYDASKSEYTLQVDELIATPEGVICFIGAADPDERDTRFREILTVLDSIQAM